MRNRSVRPLLATMSVVDKPILHERDDAVLGVSLAILLTGIAVLIGWYAHIQAAVQIAHGWVPMQYNTALCFIALGVGGIGLSTRKRVLMLGGGSVAALMGAAVILEYATGVSSGIDTLFFYPWERALSADAGRMALTTAVSFLCSGVALAILAVRPRASAVLGILNSIPLSLALTSLIGYAFQITYVLPFVLGSQMALHTSLAILAYSIAMLAHAWRSSDRGTDGLPTWVAGIGVAFLPVLFVGAGAAVFSQQSWQVVSLEAAVLARRRRRDRIRRSAVDDGAGGLQGPPDDRGAVDPAPDVHRSRGPREARKRVGPGLDGPFRRRSSSSRSHCSRTSRKPKARCAATSSAATRGSSSHTKRRS